MVHEGPEGVVTNHEIGPLLDGHVNIRRMPNAAIDVVHPVQTCRLVEERQCSRRLNGLGDRQLIDLVASENHAFGGIQVTSAQIQLNAPFALESAKIVGHGQPVQTSTQPAL